jgi:hypothetical protein
MVSRWGRCCRSLGPHRCRIRDDLAPTRRPRRFGDMQDSSDLSTASGEAEDGSTGGGGLVGAEEEVQPAEVDEGRLRHIDDQARAAGFRVEEPAKAGAQRRRGGAVEFAAEVDHRLVGVIVMQIDVQHGPCGLGAGNSLIGCHDAALPANLCGRRWWRRDQKQGRRLRAVPTVLRAEAGAQAQVPTQGLPLGRRGCATPRTIRRSARGRRMASQREPTDSVPKHAPLREPGTAASRSLGGVVCRAVEVGVAPTVLACGRLPTAPPRRIATSGDLQPVKAFGGRRDRAPTAWSRSRG